MTRAKPTQRTAHVYGLKGEKQVAQHLERCGYQIVSYNFRIQGAEIDIIARHGDTVAFIEVKASESEHSDLSELVTKRKQRCVSRAARLYIAKHNLTEYACRFDVALVHGAKKITYIENAFYADV